MPPKRRSPPDEARVRGMSGRLCRRHRFDVDFDVDSLAHEQTARFERLIPFQPEIGAIDRCLGAKEHALVAPRVLAAAELLDVERNTRA